jgi:hypothetical protein
VLGQFFTQVVKSLLIQLYVIDHVVYVCVDDLDYLFDVMSTFASVLDFQL